ncbi:GNAT family N-acetyltransferase [Burkholderiaceae bacterium DAT-1]|nr:GNAT family N-acetyltransferase [Burkholderiaceae bacterium DAT-1]
MIIQLPTRHSVSSMQFAASGVSLRKPEARDTRALFDLLADERNQRFNAAGALREFSAAELLMARWQVQWAVHGFGVWVVESLLEPGKVIGFGGLTLDASGQAARLTIRLAHDESVTDIVTTIAKASRAIAQSLPLTTVEAHIHAADAVTRSGLEQAGMGVARQQADALTRVSKHVYVLSLRDDALAA